MVTIAVTAEDADEPRVAVSPDTVKKFTDLGCTVKIEKGAGARSNFSDAEYEGKGGKIASDADAALSGADVLLKVGRPSVDELSKLKSGAIAAAMINPYGAAAALAPLAATGVSLFSMEFMPRITRAQSMDVLSSQANLAGYKAVIDGAALFGQAMPMMMTAAGTVPAAKTFVMGAGVAGLQAIATAKRLGAIVTATDVRPAAKEQVASLGGKFVAVEDEEFLEAQTAAGYAKPMSEAYQKKQSALVADHISKQNIVITTALIPGRPAPKLISEEMIKSMRPGSVIVDLAAERGGNTALTKAGETVDVNGVKIIGTLNLAGHLPVNASSLYARNLLSFLTLVIDKEEKSIKIDWEDEIIQGTLVTKDGKVVHPNLTEKAA